MSAPLPERLRQEVEGALHELGEGSRVTGAEAVMGGCIHRATRLVTEGGRAWFLKWNDGRSSGVFSAEADGLATLRRTGAVRVPEPLAWRDAVGGPYAWLLMECLDPGHPRPESARLLGQGLARIHASGSSVRMGGFGWPRNNWIGTLPQENPPSTVWGIFWRDRRLVPQLARARAAGLLVDSILDRVVERTPGALTHVRRPELLHGDLWHGNTFVTDDGRPVLVDPAVYLGDGEVDLAMAELFGGFGADFFSAYAAERPVSDAYRSHGRDLYQLYYLLAHVNLFGASYVPATLRSARRILAALG